MNDKKNENIIRFAERFGVREEIISILVSRGIDEVEKLERYFNPGKANFASPFLLSGMDKAVERIKTAIANNETVAIFGDYDADGICAVSILYLALKAEIDRVYWYIPEREEGYGLSSDAVEFIAEKYFPDLLITCDCGVSSYDEVELAKQLGIDVIVLDHHELPPVLPDCTVVDPKMDNCERLAELCGAGVTLKTVEAVFGREVSDEFLELAAIATIADSVPLLNENRDITVEGIKQLKRTKRVGLRALLAVSGVTDINSVSIVFSIVPRINAAGRVGEAKRAVTLFSSTDEDEIARTANELNSENTYRQKLCADLVASIDGSTDLKLQLKNHVLVFYSEEWQSGITGIIASKMAERYRRPTFVFSPENGAMKGSGRSVAGVNLHRLIDAVYETTDTVVRFGGHEQAAGVVVQPEKLSDFREAVNDAFTRLYSGFEAREVDADIELAPSALNYELAGDIMKMMPFGVGNRVPQIMLKSLSQLGTTPMKKHAEHLILKADRLEITAFNYSFLSPLLRCGVKKDAIVELTLNAVGGREYIKCVLRSVSISDTLGARLIDDQSSDILLGRCLCEFEKRMRSFLANANVVEYDEIDELDVFSKSDYGNLVISFENDETAEKQLCDRGVRLRRLVYDSKTRNNVNTFVYMPSSEMNVDGFENVVCVERPNLPLSVENNSVNKPYTVYVPKEYKPRRSLFGRISTNRNVFAAYYRLISANVRLYSDDEREFFSLLCAVADFEAEFFQFAFCFAVFSELGFFYAKDGKLIKTSEKKNLSESRIYSIAQSTYEITQGV